MNKKEYEKAIRDTRKALYKGKIGDVAVGLLRAFVAHADPVVPRVPPARRLNPPPAVKRIGIRNVEVWDPVSRKWIKVKPATAKKRAK